MYPLHLACQNKDCPSSVIKLLVKKDASILEKRVNDDVSDSKLFPLHYYILRQSNYDYGIMEYLVKSYPEALTYMPDNKDITDYPTDWLKREYYEEYYTPFSLLCQEFCGELSLDLVKLLVGTDNECLELRKCGLDCPPFLSLLKNSNIKPFPLDVVRYFMKFGNPGIIGGTHIFTGNALHAACSNKNISLEAMQLLLEYDYCEISSDDTLARMSIGTGTSSKKDLPIHILCQNKELDEKTSLAILNVLVDRYPESVQEHGNDGYLPIHYACVNKSFEFCKYLIEKYSECTASITRGQELQTLFHLACANGSLQLVKYLYELRPSSIHVQTYDKDYDKDDDGEYMDEMNDYPNLQEGRYALHLAVLSQHDDRKDIVRFILEKDKRAASRVGTWGRLPLHEACTSNINLDIVKDIFEAYPEAIHTKDIFGRIPIHFACGCHEYRQDWRGEGARYSLAPSKEQLSLIIDFFFEQLPYSLNARDSDGRTCAHFACGSTQALTKIDAIERNDKIYPKSFMTYSEEYGFPLQFACREEAPIEVIDRLMMMFDDLLCQDIHGTYPLHIAIRVIGTLLVAPMMSTTLLSIHKKLLVSLFKYYPSALEDVDNQGWLPLHHAVRQSVHLEIIQLLVERYPPGVQVTVKQGSTLLHIACRHGSNGKVVNCLMDKMGAAAALDVDNNGFTPLHIACKHGVPLDILHYLVRIDNHPLTMLDNSGELPLHKACRGGHLHLIKELIEVHPPSVLVRNNQNELPIFILCKRSGKDEEVRESVEYTETIWKLLLAHPETVSV